MQDTLPGLQGVHIRGIPLYKYLFGRIGTLECYGVTLWKVLLYIKKVYLGHSKVSLTRRCPYFRGVL